jgi:DNA cross-link repair 1A protein
MASKQQSHGLRAVLPCLPFAIDCWNRDSLAKPQFLSHAHKDHTVDIATYGRNIWCTDLTRELVCLKFPALLTSGATFHTLELDQPAHVACGACAYTVRAFDSNHCPGSCGFIFQGPFGTVVHTGDARLTDATIARLAAALEGAQVDLLYLDATFGARVYVSGLWEASGRAPAARRQPPSLPGSPQPRPPPPPPPATPPPRPQDFPSQAAAVAEVLALISRHHRPGGRVYLSCEMLGTEAVLAAVAAAFGARVYLPPPTTAANWQSPQLQADRLLELQRLVPHAVTTQEPGSPFWLWGGRLLPETAQQHAPASGALFIKPSTQKILLAARHMGAAAAGGRDSGGAGGAAPVPAQLSGTDGNVHYVCYSVHSSRWEALRCVEALRPRAAAPACGDIDLRHLAWLLPARQVGGRCAGASCPWAARAAAAAAAAAPAPAPAPAGPQRRLRSPHRWARSWRRA